MRTWIILFFILLFSGLGATPSEAFDAEAARAQVCAQNYAVLRRAASEALLVAVEQGSQLADTTCPAVLTNTAECDISVQTALVRQFLPAHWQPVQNAAGQSRWNIRLQNGLCYVYGPVSAQEMAAIRTLSQYSRSTVFCKNGHCLPPLQDAAGSPLPVPDILLPDGMDGIVISVTQVIP